MALRSSLNALAASGGALLKTCAAPLGCRLYAMAAQNKVPSAHWANTRDTPLRWGGYKVGSGSTCSSTSQISAVSQYTSAPTCMMGVLR